MRCFFINARECTDFRKRAGAFASYTSTLDRTENQNNRPDTRPMRSLLIILTALIALGAGYSYFYYSGTETNPVPLTSGPVGAIAKATDQTTIERDAETMPGTQGTPVEMLDRIITDPTGHARILFTDNSMLTVGDASSVVIDEFVFAPHTSRRMVIKFVEGALRFVSGKTDAPDDTIELESAVASIGVRGTDFWVGEIDGNFAVLLFDGAVEVATDAGTVTLDQPGQGVTLTTRADPPGEIKNWPQAKVDRALARVTF